MPFPVSTVCRKAPAAGVNARPTNRGKPSAGTERRQLSRPPSGRCSHRPAARRRMLFRFCCPSATNCRAGDFACRGCLRRCKPLGPISGLRAAFGGWPPKRRLRAAVQASAPTQRNLPPQTSANPAAPAFRKVSGGRERPPYKLRQTICQNGGANYRALRRGRCSHRPAARRRMLFPVLLPVRHKL